MGRINVTSSIFEGPSGPNWTPNACCAVCRAVGLRHDGFEWQQSFRAQALKHTVVIDRLNSAPWPCAQGILAEGAIALSVTLSGGALFAS